MLSLVDRIREFPVKPALCIVGEPTSMRLVLGHKSGTEHIVTVKGTAAIRPCPAGRERHRICCWFPSLSIHEIGRESAETGDHDRP